MAQHVRALVAFAIYRSTIKPQSEAEAFNDLAGAGNGEVR